jgi:hypothetical protein
MIPTRDVKLGGYTVAQTPNGPVLIATAAGVAARRSTNPRTRDVATGLYFAALVVWAWLELSDGVNLLRRLLGAATLAYVAFEVATRAGLTGAGSAGPDASAAGEAAVPGTPRVPG